MNVISRLLRSTRDDGTAQPLTIAAMRRRDLAAIQAIERQVYPKPWSMSVFTAELELVRPRKRYYITALDGTDLVGYAGLMLALDDAHVTNIAVDPSHQRGQIGSRLLAELAWEARRRTCAAMTLEVRVSNAAAQGLYRRFGFEAAGVRKNYYENVEDAIVMWCRGINTADYAARLRELSPEAAE